MQETHGHDSPGRRRDAPRVGDDPCPYPDPGPSPPRDILIVLIANALIIVGMWVRHGGLGQLSTAAGLFIGAGQVTALLGTYLALVQLVLMSRAPWLDRVVGGDRLAVWHRWAGFACLWLLVGHALLTTIGFGMSDGSGVVAEVGTLLFTLPLGADGDRGPGTAHRGRGHVHPCRSPPAVV